MRKVLISSAVVLLVLVGGGVGLYLLMNARTFQLFGGLTYRVDTEQLVAQGHQLANHSYTHTRMVFVGADFVALEIERTDAQIRKAGYGGDIVFRPPYSKKIYQLPR